MNFSEISCTHLQNYSFKKIHTCNLYESQEDQHFKNLNDNIEQPKYVNKFLHTSTLTHFGYYYIDTSSKLTSLILVIVPLDFKYFLWLSLHLDHAFNHLYIFISNIIYIQYTKKQVIVHVLPVRRIGHVPSSAIQHCSYGIFPILQQFCCRVVPSTRSLNHHFRSCRIVSKTIRAVNLNTSSIFSSISCWYIRTWRTFMFYKNIHLSIVVYFYSNANW